MPNKWLRTKRWAFTRPKPSLSKSINKKIRASSSGRSHSGATSSSRERKEEKEEKEREREKWMREIILYSHSMK